MCSELGLPSDNPTERLCWSGRVYLQTGIETLRGQNGGQHDTRPYEAVYSASVLGRNAELNREIEKRATYGAVLICGKENTLEDLSALEDDSDWMPFTLPFSNGGTHFMYGQPYHGAVHLPTGRFHLYSYHPEPILRDNLHDEGLQIADQAVNIFAALVGIKAVRLNAFANFKRSTITNASLLLPGAAESPDGKHRNGASVLKDVFMMRWVEKTHKHRFSSSQLTAAMKLYAEKENLILDDDDEDSPALQINRYMGRKSAQVQANIIYPDGKNQLQHKMLKAQRLQTANGNLHLHARLAVERELGWPLLARNRQLQLDTNYAAHRAAIQKRFDNWQDQLMRDVEANNDHKRAADPDFQPAPMKRPDPARPQPKTPKLKCQNCGKNCTEGGLATHMRNKHDGLSSQYPHKCPHVTCNKHFETTKEQGV